MQGLSTYYAHPRGDSLAQSKEQEEVTGLFPHFGFPFGYYMKHSSGRKWAGLLHSLRPAPGFMVKAPWFWPAEEAAAVSVSPLGG